LPVIVALAKLSERLALVPVETWAGTVRIPPRTASCSDEQAPRTPRLEPFDLLKVLAISCAERLDDDLGRLAARDESLRRSKVGVKVNDGVDGL
jgi:hypothetical protein